MIQIRLGFLSLLVLVTASACGHGGGSEAPRGAEPTKPTTPTTPPPTESKLPFLCVAESAEGSDTFAYPAEGTSSAYESPTRSFRVELTRSAGTVEMVVWGREGDFLPYQRSPFPFRYQAEEQVKFHYALKATVTTAGTTEVDPWWITCDHADRLPKSLRRE